MLHIKNDIKDYYLDDNGKRHGEYKEWYTNGQLYEHSHYVDDKLHGEHKLWYGNGQLYEHSHHDHGQRHGEIHGEYKKWYPSGQLYVHAYVINDEEIHDLLDNPLSDEERFELQLIHGGKWLD